MTINKYVKNILGVDVRARFSIAGSGNNYDPFKNPIIHKQINGREIVPLNVKKLWGK
ncbi:hypothetical protein [Neobacillus bataviensis]|uniref:hypothetical protein n=1 Tax=Neobacillus bataviensis TaxID=220685 RepID=UPI001CBBD3C2|nr:hypothetical protein [Neobacillus bataviensis]